MENASKALLMAGGMLITIIILGVLAMAWNNMRELPKTQEQIKEAEELAAFNKKYESYAKNNIRGADLVTVVNMAVNNNNKYSGQADMQIDINYTITKPMENVIRKYKLKNGQWKLDEVVSSMSLTERTYMNNNLQTGFSFQEFTETTKSNVKYSLNETGPWYDENVIEKEIAIKGEYYTKTNVGAEFRRKKFDCDRVEYNEIGRISAIYYEER